VISEASVPGPVDGAAPEALGRPDQDVQAYQRSLLRQEEAAGTADAGELAPKKGIYLFSM
jgi:hypothetical protein